MPTTAGAPGASARECLQRAEWGRAAYCSRQRLRWKTAVAGKSRQSRRNIDSWRLAHQVLRLVLPGLIEKLNAGSRSEVRIGPFVQGPNDLFFRCHLDDLHDLGPIRFFDPRGPIANDGISVGQPNRLMDAVDQALRLAHGNTPTCN